MSNNDCPLCPEDMDNDSTKRVLLMERYTQYKSFETENKIFFVFGFDLTDVIAVVILFGKLATIIKKYA